MSTFSNITLAQATSTPWDVVVVGAGPAGSIAARQIAVNSKTRVLLLDHATFPRDKVCGGCLSNGAVQVLNQIGLASVLQRTSAPPLRRLEIRNGRAPVRFHLDGGHVVNRREFDSGLVQEALRADVRFVDGVSVDLNRRCHAPDDHHIEMPIHCAGSSHFFGSLSARLIIDASGLSGKPDWRSSHSYIGSGCMIDASPSASLAPGEVLMSCSSKGYVGLAGSSAGQIIVAAAWSPTAVQRGNTMSDTAHRILDLNDASHMAPDLQRARWRSTPWLTQHPHHIGDWRFLCIGDAAGYVEPFTGDGMTSAIQMAVCASEHVAALLHQPQWDVAKQRRWESHARSIVRARHRRSHILRQILRSQTFTDAALQVVRTLHRPAQHAVLHHFGSRRSVSSLFLRSAASA